MQLEPVGRLRTPDSEALPTDTDIIPIVYKRIAVGILHFAGHIHRLSFGSICKCRRYGNIILLAIIPVYRNDSRSFSLSNCLCPLFGIGGIVHGHLDLQAFILRSRIGPAQMQFIFIFGLGDMAFDHGRFNHHDLNFFTFHLYIAYTPGIVICKLGRSALRAILPYGHQFQRNSVRLAQGLDIIDIIKAAAQEFFRVTRHLINFILVDRIKAAQCPLNNHLIAGKRSAHLESRRCTRCMIAAVSHLDAADIHLVAFRCPVKDQAQGRNVIPCIC